MRKGQKALRAAVVLCMVLSLRPLPAVMTEPPKVAPMSKTILDKKVY